MTNLKDNKLAPICNSCDEPAHNDSHALDTFTINGIGTFDVVLCKNDSTLTSTV